MPAANRNPAPSQPYRVFYEHYQPDGVTVAGRGSLVVHYVSGFIGPAVYVQAEAHKKLTDQQAAGEINNFKIVRTRTI